MNGRDDQKFAETPGERRVEAMLRRAETWKPNAPEPTGLAYRALAKRGLLDSALRRHRLPRSWLSLGTLGVGAALTAFLFVHPMDIAPVATPTPEPAPAVRIADAKPSPKKAASANDVAKNGSEKPSVEAAVSPAVSPRSPLEDLRPIRKLETLSRRRSRRWLAHNRRPVVKRRETPIPVVPEKSHESLIANNANSGELAPAAQDYRVLVPVVITHESEDGSEIVATPVVVEMAYNAPPYAGDTADYGPSGEESR